MVIGNDDMSAFPVHAVMFRCNNYWHRIAKNGLQKASLVPDALERSTVIRNDEMSAFPGHSVMFRGNICLDL